ncbi:MAG: hypothetical protein E5W00_16480, partial [Mesorhizobium sp.]
MEAGPVQVRKRFCDDFVDRREEAILLGRQDEGLVAAPVADIADVMKLAARVLILRDHATVHGDVDGRFGFSHMRGTAANMDDQTFRLR